MDISVILVSWNVRDHVRNCLQSILDQTKDIDYEVIVVDNDSHDGTVEMIREEFPWVKVIASDTNLGFGKANNRGAEIATGDIVFVLNDDTILTENSLKIVYDKVMQEQEIGVLGYHLTNPDGSHQDSVRRYPQLLDQVLILLKLHNFFPRIAPIRRYFAQDFDYTKEQDVDQVMGACMVMRKEVFDKAGGFDERFFVWFEEVDLQKRILEEQGLRIVYSPITEMIHVKGASFSQLMSLNSQKLFNRSMRQYFAKHNGLLRTAVLMAVQPLSLLLAWVVQALKARGANIRKLKQGND